MVFDHKKRKLRAGALHASADTKIGLPHVAATLCLYFFRATAYSSAHANAVRPGSEQRRELFARELFLFEQQLAASLEHILMLQLRELIRRTKDGGDHRAVGNWFNVGCMLPWIQYAPKTLDEILDADENFVLLRDSGNHGSCLSIKGCD